jgi:uncharacterized protein
MQNIEQRHISLDAMRGFAVMGILAMNIIGFAMPEWAYVTPEAYGTETLADQIAWAFSFIFIDGKMRGLFSLLFGASMMLIIDRAVAKGESAAQVHYRRMAWLALFGLAHYFFIWFGDILFLYAIIGMIAFRFRNWSPERLIKVALIIFSVVLALWGAQLGGLQVFQYLATRPDASAEMARRFRELMDSAGLAFNIAPDLALHRGSYAAITLDKLGEWSTPMMLVVQSISETLPLMMIGMAMQKSGFMTGDRDAADYRRWVMRMVPAGLLLTAALAVWMVAVDFDRITALAVLYFRGGVPRLMLTIGYAAVLILRIGHYRNHPMLARVAAAGRAAFSNYLGTSLIMTTIFYGYGFGLFGHVGRAGLWLFVLGAWALMLLWSKPWLMKFHYGPLEWLWRSLALGKMQVMRR